jgi:hypothetical protein
MSVIHNDLLLATDEATGYNLTKSLRLRASASAYLNRTPASAGNRTAWTLSFWTKLANFGTNRTIINVGGLSTNYGLIFFNTNNVLDFQEIAGTGGRLTTTRVFRDPSAWYHIVVVWDTANATAGDRMRVYVNGVRETSFTTQTNPSLSANSFINTSAVHRIGWETSGTAGWQKDGYLAEVNFIDGQALTPSSFGETDTITGVWKPKAYTGTYGTNGFYLPFTDVATTSGSNAGLGKDFSGNGNYFNTNNISVTAGATYDSMTDVPTLTSATAANYCVLNPLNNAGNTVSNGNLTATGIDSNYRAISATMGVSSGKYYWEATFTGTTTSICFVGIAASSYQQVVGYYTGYDAATYGYYGNSGNKLNNNSFAAYGATFGNNDVMGIALDMDAGTLTFYKNNTSQGVAYTGLTGSYMPNITNYGTSVCNVNFGQQGFTYTPPTGFKALNTYNLPDSTIVAGNKIMDATTYTGNGSTQTITNAGGFKPDLVWVKSRSAATDNKLTDSVRGTTKGLISNTTGAETTDTNGLTAFGSSGFTVGTDTNYNNNTATYVGWQWQAGQGSSSSNTSGSITSTVSVNASAGFSVVTYTGTGSIATIGHGLGVAPAMIIIKARSAAQSWLVYHRSIGNTGFVYLNETTVATYSINGWNNTSPTSTVFTTGVNGLSNASGQTQVAYCWSEIDGFSKFGSYTGNGSTDGPFVYTGFRPKFVMYKRTDSTGSWFMLDSTRNTSNVTNLWLQANTNEAEQTDAAIDFLSNGFKQRTTGSGSNASGGTYIYMAFAENPFKNSLAR